MSTPFQRSSPAIPIRGLHLDLKGTPPTFARLMELLDLFAALRYNLVLVEWEDAFPWSIDPSFRASTAYTEEEVARFVEKAASLGLELVPLVQTLGHMENFLKSDAYRPLRESQESNDVLNPLANGARELVQAMVRDVLRLMPDVRRFHLGGDEAWCLGTHPQTAAFVQENSASALYLHHMQPLLDLLNSAKIRPLLWHDMMIHWEDEALRNLAKQCDLVVWGYQGHPDASRRHFNSTYVARFAELGFTLWGGTAFKGADGTSADRPDIAARHENAQGWIEVAQRHLFAGLITTGWSRYCYNTCQCETLEASLDTLLMHAVQFHDGCAPVEIAHEAPKWLESLWSKAEGERFAHLLAAAQNFSNAHNAVWDWMRLHLTHIGAVNCDPKRKKIRQYTETGHFSRLEKTAQEYHDQLLPLIPAVHVKSYFEERVPPVMQLSMTTFSQ